jgi:hypothetical protein
VSINTPEVRQQISDLIHDHLSGRVRDVEAHDLTGKLFHLLNEASARLEPSPRVWFPGDDVPAGTWVLSRNGYVDRILGSDDGDEAGAMPIAGPVVEVQLPDYREAVDFETEMRVGQAAGGAGMGGN